MTYRGCFLEEIDTFSQQFSSNSIGHYCSTNGCTKITTRITHGYCFSLACLPETSLILHAEIKHEIKEQRKHREPAYTTNNRTSEACNSKLACLVQQTFM
ncbi:hypothetical protein WN48_05095 [Eufriesea mexicana]|nr:hypothetical protein WN48_05095 [Eufriesea mexicana]